MEEKKKKKKQKHQHPNDQFADKPPITSSDFSLKPVADVKGLRFGGQFIVKSFTIHRARPLELLKLLSLPLRQTFLSTTAFIPTNFTILAHHAWHTLTLGLATKKSKIVVFVFESEAMKAAAERTGPAELPLEEVNKRLIRVRFAGDPSPPEEKLVVVFGLRAVSRATGEHKCFPKFTIHY